MSEYCLVPHFDSLLGRNQQLWVLPAVSIATSVGNLSPDEGTLDMYPYDFTLRIEFEIPLAMTLSATEGRPPAYDPSSCWTPTTPSTVPVDPVVPAILSM